MKLESKFGIVVTFVITSMMVLLVLIENNQPDTYNCEDYDFVTCTNNWHDDFMNTYDFNPDDVKHFERWITPTHVELGCGNWDTAYCHFSEESVNLLADEDSRLAWNVNGTVLTIKKESQNFTEVGMK